MTDKLIIVDITDKEYLNMDSNSEVKEIRGDGKLVIKNPSEKSRRKPVTNLSSKQESNPPPMQQIFFPLRIREYGNGIQP